MKQIFSLVVAGMVGGLITLGGVQLMAPDAPAPTSQDVIAQQIRNVNVPAGQSTTFVDFKTAAAKAMPAVVGISASAGTAQVDTQEGEEEDYNPFRFFFGDDLLGSPFGGGNTPQQGSGSGIIYTSDGYILTNNHVVEFADKVIVTLYDNREFEATVVGTNKKSDVAVLKNLG